MSTQTNLNEADDARIETGNFLLREGDGIQLYNRIYKVTAIRDNGERIILKRARYAE